MTPYLVFPDVCRPASTAHCIVPIGDVCECHSSIIFATLIETFKQITFYSTLVY